MRRNRRPKSVCRFEVSLQSVSRHVGLRLCIHDDADRRPSFLEAGTLSSPISPCRRRCRSLVRLPALLFSLKGHHMSGQFGKFGQFEALIDFTLHIGNSIHRQSMKTLVNRYINDRSICGFYHLTPRGGVLECIKNSKGRKQPANTTEQHAHVHFLCHQACVQNTTSKETEQDPPAHIC